LTRTAYSVVRHDWNFKCHWLLWSDETKIMSFLAANTQKGFGEQKYPWYILQLFLMLWAYISAGGPGHLV